MVIAKEKVVPAKARGNAQARNTQTLPPIRLAACRDIGHGWMYTEWSEASRTLVCERCGTRRIDQLDRGYHIAHRNYRYEKAYHIPGRGRARTLLPEIRRMLFKSAKRLGVAWRDTPLAETPPQPSASV